MSKQTDLIKQLADVMEQANKIYKKLNLNNQALLKNLLDSEPAFEYESHAEIISAMGKDGHVYNGENVSPEDILLEPTTFDIYNDAKGYHVYSIDSVFGRIEHGDLICDYNWNYIWTFCQDVDGNDKILLEGEVNQEVTGETDPIIIEAKEKIAAYLSRE